MIRYKVNFRFHGTREDWARGGGWSRDPRAPHPQYETLLVFCISLYNLREPTSNVRDERRE